jgi:integral membrane protein
MKTIVTILGYLEGLSFLILLGFAMPMKYLFGDPAPVSLVGAVHGFLFIAYLAALYLGVGKHWNRSGLIHGSIAAVLPAGPFLFDGMLASGKYDIDE